MFSVVVIDYGSSNLRSVVRALEAVVDDKHSITICRDPERILKADKVIFPGQGAIGQCMRYLHEKDLVEIVQECILNKPFLGICLGLQSLMEHSEEDGGVDGLGILPGKVKRFASNVKDENGNHYKVPAMGWNQVYQEKKHPLWKDVKDGGRFYFVHSYYVIPEREADIVGTTEYIHRYTSVVARDNLFATQFHPEKSQHLGLTLLKNFFSWKI